MSNKSLKVLDENGVKHLWSKISMEDYPNNEVLIAALEAIDETKIDKEKIGDLTTLTTTEQGSIVGAINEVKNSTGAGVFSFHINYVPGTNYPYEATKSFREIRSAIENHQIVEAQYIQNHERQVYYASYIYYNDSDENDVRIYFIKPSEGIITESFIFYKDGSIESNSFNARINYYDTYYVPRSSNILTTTNKMVISAINEVNEKASAIVDWNQNDETATDYVKNRTHYSTDDITTEIATATIAGTSFDACSYNDVDYGWDWNASELRYDTTFYNTLCTVGATGFIKVNDTTYTGIIKDVNEGAYTHRLIGNPALTGMNYEDSGENFLYVIYSVTSSGQINTPGTSLGMVDMNVGALIVPTSNILESNTISVGAIQEGELKQLDEKFIPDTIARTEEVTSSINEISNTLNSRITLNSVILTDAVTGDLYKIQIQNGQLVSFPVESESAEEEVATS